MPNRNIRKQIPITLVTIFIFGAVGVVRGDAQGKSDNRNWKTFSLPVLSFGGPSNLTPVPSTGDDSEVWQFKGPSHRIVIDYGLYSVKDEGNINEENYREKSVRIQGKRVVLINFRFKKSEPTDFSFVTVAYFSAVGAPENKLSFTIYTSSIEQQGQAERIIRSIKLTN